MSSNGSARILIVDDQEIFRRALHRLVETEVPGSQCMEAANGVEAVAHVRESRPDLVIMDLAMPELNGIDALSRMIAEFPDLRVIMLTVMLDRHQIEQALRMGAKGYLLKQSSVAELLAGIVAGLEGKTYLCPAVAEVVVRNHVRHRGVPNDGSESPFSQLSNREREVLQLLAEGQTSKEIAARLFIGIKTVESHRSQLMTKLNIRTIAGLTKYAIRAGLTSL